MKTHTATTGTVLPAHLRGISRVVVDETVQSSPLAARVRKRLSHLDWSVKPEGPLEDTGETVLYLKNYKGRFLKPCPGTSEYRCCGYRIVHIGENCPLSCSYCILQAYFQDRVLKVWANQDSLFKELETAFSKVPGKRFRVGTGEFTDSLVLEPLTGFSRDLVAFLGGFENVCLELKSKVVDLSWMDAVRRPDRVLPAWSMNAPTVQNQEEGGSATLEERLRAAQTCAQAGFRVCLHFDPMIHFPGWQKEYARTATMIFDHLRPEQIAYVSMGSFRCMPDLKRVIKENHPQARYIYNEFISGLDGKMRLLRSLRVEQFSFLARALQQGGLDRQLYLCMESDTVWTQALGYTPKKLGGLARHLERQGFGE
ncbi:MAG: radical SAM protein [Desulfovibrionales bacterium]